MIDKNDVKMPVQRDNITANPDPEQIRKIEDLLDLVSAVENKQELRLKSDYYSRFYWFGTDVLKTDKSYFSYQEEAVYDFIFNLNKSGILSDQVGMGKTIEAGMIISELASRNELRSLLIIVPNEIMARKWEVELADKFGIQRIENHEKQQYFPGVKTLKDFDDFCECVFECLADEKFVDLSMHEFTHKYKPKDGVKESLETIIASYVKEDIAEAIRMINEGFEQSDFPDTKASFDGSRFRIDSPNFKGQRSYVYDRGGAISEFAKQWAGAPATFINSSHFTARYNKTFLKQELSALYHLLGEFFTTIPAEISALSESMTNKYPILVIPINYSKHYPNGEVRLAPFLNYQLMDKVENYKHKYMVQDDEGSIHEVYEEYRIVDFFIDVGYQTLIVDEVHDYIDVCAKINRMQFHQSPESRLLHASSTHDRYELFDEYHFIEKKSLYKKLKSLADKANRKIFLTATPIKSDMVDFYLLTLLASNKDSEAYKKISDNLEIAYPDSSEREEAIETLYNAFKAYAEFVAPGHFCKFTSQFFASENGIEGSALNTGRYRYAYFNNSFLRENLHQPDLIKDYLLSQISYMSMEEIILELILSYMAENSEGKQRADMGIQSIIEDLQDLFGNLEGDFLQTRIVFRSLFNNTLKARFEEDFTTPDGKPIKRIRELLELDDGARKWHKTYRKYGIRHTRHQTYNLANCNQLEKLSKNRIERYKNLPVWPRRNGKVIFLVRDDVFFDCFLQVKRDLAHVAASAINLEDLPNYDKLLGNEEQKQERFQNALSIFDYINNAMSGGEPDTHEPSSSTYDSIDLNDDGMIEYKLALVNKLMDGSDRKLGAINNKVLLFAENGREQIVEWFRYQGCMQPAANGIDPAKLAEYERKWKSYGVRSMGAEWKVSEDAGDLGRPNDGKKLLIIIDPSRYEKGVDLQKADTLINFDINYCPLKMEQRIGRIDRIRPSGNTPEINIVSFVPLNDMSGFVINFFANEMKMFTQWMGETTGIVSVPDESNASARGEDVSFEGRVAKLEDYYQYLYRLCSKDTSKDEINEMVKAFREKFGVDDVKAEIDFLFLRALRPVFDRAFRNSVSPHRAGMEVDNSKARTLRFNSSQSIFSPCMATSCAKCSHRDLCHMQGSVLRNSYAEFAGAVREFFKEGVRYYQDARRLYQARISNTVIQSTDGASNIPLTTWLQQREESFNKALEAVEKLLPAPTKDPMAMDFAVYEKIFNPMKQLYWDSVVESYMNLILDQFHKQCDSVLSGARLFERFIKMLSIADFMNNMEGTV